MGLDMRPMGKPKPGLENRFEEIFALLSGKKKESFGLWGMLTGRKPRTQEELTEEWFAIQVPSYETLKAPQVGRDAVADIWIEQKYKETKKDISLTQFIQDHSGYYIIELSPEQDGVPVYISWGNDENVFRGQFLTDCVDIIGEELANEAWESKLAPDALDYGNRLMIAADKIALATNLTFLKEQRLPPDASEDSLESKLHIVFSLAKWLIFYGKNGHGYEADY